MKTAEIHTKGTSLPEAGRTRVLATVTTTDRLKPAHGHLFSSLVTWERSFHFENKESKGGGTREDGILTAIFCMNEVEYAGKEKENEGCSTHLVVLNGG